MNSQNLSQHNFLIPNDLWELLIEEQKETGKSQSEIVREALSDRYNKPSYRREKKMPIRIKNAVSIFDILSYLTEDEKGQKFTQFWLSWPDIMEVKFGRWSFAKQAVSIFSKLCRELKHPVQWEQVIVEIPIPGTNRKRMSKEGFNLFFENPITQSRLKTLGVEARLLVDKDDFEDTLMRHPSDEVVKSRKDFARELLKGAIPTEHVDDIGDGDAEGFDTIN